MAFDLLRHDGVDLTGGRYTPDASPSSGSPGGI